jgi:hypothetical protein
MTTVDEQTLIEKLRRIEALFAGAMTLGERDAAAEARERIQQRLAATEHTDPPREYRFSLPDPWTRKLFIALLRRYGIRPFRYKRQRATTVMARVPESFVDDTLWPEFQELADTLTQYLADVTDRVIREGIDGDASDADVLDDRTLPA